eukprot:TRINITY_DN32477_c0_g1_i1.p1 TRINITY_DN32477_c0_g1~~TRINITY_DN32477_c0_g1_i1.p1  ORF type:complete len:409 (-),score=38.41 TRINITY_DN32477_c0_g1_i1:286-1512(-)
MIKPFTYLLACVAVLSDVQRGARVQMVNHGRLAEASAVGVKRLQRAFGPRTYVRNLFRWLRHKRRLRNGTLNFKLTIEEAEQKIGDLHMWRIGEGTYGEVFRAFDFDEHLNVIVKKINRNNSAVPPELVRILSDECGVTEELQRDSSRDPVGASRLVRCYFNAAETPQHMIIMEDAGDDIYAYLKLARKRAARRALPWVQEKSRIVKDVFVQVLQGVKYMSDQHMWHRDIKPSNIAILDLPNGSLEVKIIDFGFAGTQPDLLLETDKVFEADFGDFIYAPLELRQYHKQYDAARMLRIRFPKNAWRRKVETALLASVQAYDLWSVGVSLLQLICGAGLNERMDTDFVGRLILPRLFPKANTQQSGSLSAHIDNVLQKSGCWKFHKRDQDILDMLSATLNRDAANRFFP